MGLERSRCLWNITRDHAFQTRFCACEGRSRIGWEAQCRCSPVERLHILARADGWSGEANAAVLVPRTPGGETRAADEGGHVCERFFRSLARNTANLVGTYWAFSLALLAVCVWAATGPYFNYSDTWQLVINTGTTIVTFLMVFLIQNAQNRDARIIELKLDELLRGVEGARTGFVKLDHMSDEELESIKKEFARLREKYAPLVDDDLWYVDREISSRKAGRYC